MSMDDVEREAAQDYRRAVADSDPPYLDIEVERPGPALDPGRHPAELSNVIARAVTTWSLRERPHLPSPYFSMRYGIANEVQDALRDAGYTIMRPMSQAGEDRSEF